MIKPRDRGPRKHLLVVGGADVEKRLELVRRLAREFRVTVAGPDPAHGERFEEVGVEYVHYPLERGATPWTDMKTLVHCYRLVRRTDPDVVHAFTTKPAVWSRIAARAAGAPVVVGTLPGRGSLFWASGPRVWMLRNLYRGLQAVACRCSDLTVFYNESDARKLTGFGVVPSEQAAVVPGSGVPTEEFDPDRVPERTRRRRRREIGAGPDEVVVTMVARVIRTKGVLEFAEAAEALAGQGVDTRFVLVGPHDPGSVDSLAAADLERVERSVTWLGERSDVKGILAASDVFALPSYGEGIPRALMEACAMSLPVVTTGAPGCRTVVDDGVDGRLVPPRDAAALTRAIRELAEDPGLRDRLGREARRTAVEQYDTDVIVERVISHYRRLADEPGGAVREDLGSAEAPTRPGRLLRRRGTTGRTRGGVGSHERR